LETSFLYTGNSTSFLGSSIHRTRRSFALTRRFLSTNLATHHVGEGTSRGTSSRWSSFNIWACFSHHSSVRRNTSACFTHHSSVRRKTTYFLLLNRCFKTSLNRETSRYDGIIVVVSIIMNVYRKLISFSTV
jgi:hypothetical protein